MTLRVFTDEGFRRRPHSVHDASERLRLPAIERSVALLQRLVERADASPERVAELDRRGLSELRSPAARCALPA